MVHGMHPTLCCLITIYKEVSIQTIVEPRKFSEYLFKEGADHGKNRVFESLGYGKQHSEKLATLYQKQ